MEVPYEERSREDLILEIVGLQRVISSLNPGVVVSLPGQDLFAAETQLKLFSHLLIFAEEGERRRIARELHDEIGQTLMAIKINLKAAIRVQQNSELLHRLEESSGLIDRVIQQIRTLSFELRPSLLDDFGLVAAIRSHCQAMATRLEIAVHFVADPMIERLEPEVETVCFRVAQESLNNAAKHAKASEIRVEIRHSDRDLKLTVADNGRGFDVEAAKVRAANGVSLGLSGMRERASLVGGRLSIESRPGQGTEVALLFPIGDRASNSSSRKSGS